ncbi:MAG TPA: hypothetical protein VGF30_10600 [Bacteroidia bacterium]
MKKLFSTFLGIILLAPYFAAAHIETRESVPAYSITSTSADNTLRKGETKFVFTCLDPVNKQITKPVKYSYNGKEATVTPDVTGKFALKIPAGKYKFQFFVNGNYEEIYTDSIPGKSKTKTDVRLNFRDALIQVIADKPVIYLYPTKETNVSVKLDLEEKMLFTYPQYNNGWNVTANPGGNLTQNGKTYSYLFWEGKTEIKKADVNYKEGFVVSSESLLAFFEEKLTKMGLSSKEQQDFITYWVPRMSKVNKHYIHFLFNNEFDKYAHLTISPKPDNTFRVFMIWDPLEEDKEIIVKEQQLQSINRTGFSVVEWGGTEVNYFTEEIN